jgi:hypothetical protein
MAKETANMASTLVISPLLLNAICAKHVNKKRADMHASGGGMQGRGNRESVVICGYCDNPSIKGKIKHHLQSCDTIC